jgi:hypothetical protein
LHSWKYRTLLRYIGIVWLIIKEGNNDKRYDTLQRLEKKNEKMKANRVCKLKTGVKLVKEYTDSLKKRVGPIRGVCRWGSVNV